MRNKRILQAELAELREGRDEVVRGEIRQLLSLIFLAENYRLDEEELIEALLDSRPRGGAEGTPNISEFLALEVGAALGIRPQDAAGRICSALDLKYRHPHLFAAVLDGHVRVWQAKLITGRVAGAGLSLAAVSQVDEDFVRKAKGLPFGRALKILDALILEADPEQASYREERAKRSREVWFSHSNDGVTEIGGRIDAADALLLQASTRQLADMLQAEGDQTSAQERQAKALGLLANPARALQFLQTHIQETLVDSQAPCTCDEPTIRNQPTQAPEEACPTHGAHVGCCGHSARYCGTITIDPAKLLPKAELVVHISTQTLIDREGVARVPNLGPIGTETLQRFLANTRVTVRPVIDLNQEIAVDAYEIPDAVRFATSCREPYESFPYSTTRAKHCDLDHVTPYYLRGGPGQTRASNLTHLSRRVHRAKTAGHWILHQNDPTSYRWESPLGYTYIWGPRGTRELIPEQLAAPAS